MRALRSIRGRVAALATAAVAAVLLAVGSVTVTTFAERERDRFDARLAEPSPRALGRALAEGRSPPNRAGRLEEHSPRHEPRPDGGPGRLGPPPVLGGRALRPEGEFVRLLDGRTAIAAVDAPRDLPLARRDGFRTVRAGGTTYRTLVRTTPEGLTLEVGGDLSGLRERVGALRARVIVVSLFGVVVAGALAWWLAGFALRPLGGLRTAVAQVSGTRDSRTGSLPRAGSRRSTRSPRA